MNTVTLMIESANSGRGRTLTNEQLKQVLGAWENLLAEAAMMRTQLEGMDIILDAYLAEFGNELLERVVEESVITGEPVNAIQESDQPSEVNGVDSPPEREESEPVPETVGQTESPDV